LAEAKCHIGTMGWGYAFWEGNFYPEGTHARDYLKEYSRHFMTVEVDSTFYRIPPAAMVKNWKAQVPDGFVFSAKFPQDITRAKMLRDAAGETEAFVGNMALLREKLGVLLIQLPYEFGPENFSVLKSFLHELPKGFRYAVEAKNKKWLDESLYRLLGDFKMGLVLVDHPWMPEMDTLTADFAYIRWEGDREKVVGTTGKQEADRNADIRKWVPKVKRILGDGKEVFGYFSKHYSGYAPIDADYMLKLLGQPRPEP
jgi:uncharacterized protein YecE (DUF72 family)